MTDKPDDDPGGFLTRWSRRKVQVRQGAAPSEPELPAPAPPPAVAVAVPVPVAAAVAPPAAAEVANASTAPAPPPAPTLADVAKLGRDSDFTRFVAPGVDTGVKNAALKKLFADPHYNIMDGLDIYIDDYGKPDPLPAGMLRQMAQSQFLGLFDDEKPDAEAAATPQPETPAQVEASAPQSPPAVEAGPTSPEPEPDEDLDLRLQPHDATGPAGPGQGPGPDTGRQR